MVLCLFTLALLSACAGQGHGPRLSATQEAARYAARAKHSYTPPGPPEDPWGPYIAEASKRFDVPEAWIRGVMRVESGGNLFINGQLTTSGAGAMGLMQVMPDTYDGLRERYGLGDDPYDPHDNILAGAAYIREMYDLYGSPGFLAAYNAGPGRLDDYLTRNRPLPAETRRYVAMIGPSVIGSSPVTRSAAEQYAANAMPVNVPAGPRYASASAPVSVPVSAPVPDVPAPRPEPQPVEVAQLPPEPPRTPVPEQRIQTAATTYTPPAPPRRGGWRLISPAMADTLPTTRAPSGAGGHWAIQVGAFGSASQAEAAVNAARKVARAEASSAQPAVTPVQHAKAVLYRARLTGMSRSEATQACERLSRGRGTCIVLSPDAQS